MKYYLIINNEVAVSSNDFDSLVSLKDATMKGFVVEAKDWNAQKAAIEAMTVHMQKDGVILTGKNLDRIKRLGMELSDAEFTYLMRHTFVNGEYGSDIDVFYSARNEYALARIATQEQKGILKAYLN